MYISGVANNALILVVFRIIARELLKVPINADRNLWIDDLVASSNNC
jgi:hypothetical protein